MKEYYLILFKYPTEVFYCIWFTSDEDGSVDGIMAENGFPLVFQSPAMAQAYCDEKGMALQSGVTAYDVSKMRKWLHGRSHKVDSIAILNFWNIFTDFAVTIGIRFDQGAADNDLYDKVFFGNNLPAIRGSGELYYPRWSESELTRLRELIAEGFEMLDGILPGVTKKGR